MNIGQRKQFLFTPNKHAVHALIVAGKSLSVSLISDENLLIILPKLVVSKKTIGTRIMTCSKLLCIILAAASVPMYKANVEKNTVNTGKLKKTYGCKFRDQNYKILDATNNINYMLVLPKYLMFMKSWLKKHYCYASYVNY